ncbi:MAG: SDR family oxidoreductase [bacterium]
MKKVIQSFNLKDRVAIITGGAGLLGQKHAEAIAELGGLPVLLDTDEEKGYKKASTIAEEYSIKCRYIPCDITNEAQLEEVKNEVLSLNGNIDILINNAAIDPKVKKFTINNTSRYENFSVEQWNLEIAVGLTGTMLSSKIFGYEMAKAGKGVIVNVSSDLGIIAPDQRLYKKDGLPEEQQLVKPVTYSVIKHGLIGITKYLATYWADKGIRVNSISPGGVYTEQSDEFVERISNLIPLGRMANVEEYKAAIVFLCSDASSYMTGANLVIDGGRSIW